MLAPDSPAISCLISRFRPCLPLTILPDRSPGYYLSLLSSTTSFAYPLLVTHLLGSAATQPTTGPVCLCCFWVLTIPVTPSTWFANANCSALHYIYLIYTYISPLYIRSPTEEHLRTDNFHLWGKKLVIFTSIY